MTTVGEIIDALERRFPSAWQEEWDNSGLAVGDPERRVTKVVAAVDVTEAVVDDAIAWGAELIVAHHPLVFRPLKQLTPRTWVERTVLKAVEGGVAVYCAHTNVDVAPQGLNFYIGRRMGLQGMKPLVPHTRYWQVTTYVPPSFADAIRQAVWAAGGGRVPGLGYDRVSYGALGQGTYAETGAPHAETAEEVRLEFTVDAAYLNPVMEAVRRHHPYQEPVLNVAEVRTADAGRGLGVVGRLPDSMRYRDFLEWCRALFAAPMIQWTPAPSDRIERVAFVGGSGAPFLNHTVWAGADVFITADVKYHQFFEAVGRIGLISLNHYDSEKAVMDLFVEVIQRDFSNIAARKTHVDTNPIAYL